MERQTIPGLGVPTSSGGRPRPRSRISAAILVVALAAAACTNQRPPEQTALPDFDPPATTPAPTTTPSLDVVSEADHMRVRDVAGRILVLGRDWSIFTVQPDGSRPVVIAPANDVRRAQPTWSPDGSRIAWTEEIGEDSYQLVIASADGAEQSRADSPIQAQYLAWSPDGASVAFMGNDFWGEMQLAVAQAGQAAAIIGTGAPMYVDWAPDSDALLVHIEERFELIALTGETLTTIPTDGQFRVGTHAGERIIYSVDGGEVGEILTVASPNGVNPLPLIRFSAPAAVVTHEHTDRLAVMSTWTPEGVEISESTLSDLPILVPENLVVIDLEDGAVTPVAEGRAVSWAWSPDGEHLLFSTIAFMDGIQKIQWHEWNGSGATTYEAFTPTSRFGNGYLSFFDQYERSVSLWSPDSSAFVYAGGTHGGPAGIWVQPIDSGSPILIADGINATWSP